MPWYAVAIGRKQGKSFRLYLIMKGVFTQWKQAETLIKGFKGAKFRKFGTEAEAWDFVRNQTGARSISAANTAVQRPPSPPRVQPPSGHAAQAIEIFTDGSCINNGKPNARAGIGIWFGKNDERNRAEKLIEGTQTNQRAELWAVIRAVQLTAPALDAWDTLIIWTDSAYVQKGINEWMASWERKGWVKAGGTPVLNLEFWQQLKLEIENAKCTVKLQKVLGHSGNEGNEGADKLANIGAFSTLDPYENAHIEVPVAAANINVKDKNVSPRLIYTQAQNTEAAVKDQQPYTLDYIDSQE